MSHGQRVMSGTFGHVYINGNAIAEITGAQAKVSFNKSDIQVCGSFMTDTKVTGGKGTGNIDGFKVRSMPEYLENLINGSAEARYTIVLYLNDPEAYGYERVSLYNCSFDDETLMDFAAGSPCTVSRPFTFNGWAFANRVTNGNA